MHPACAFKLGACFYEAANDRATSFTFQHSVICRNERNLPAGSKVCSASTIRLPSQIVSEIHIGT